jgi:hypothetical protein
MSRMYLPHPASRILHTHTHPYLDQRATVRLEHSQIGGDRAFAAIGFRAEFDGQRVRIGDQARNVRLELGQRGVGGR